MSFQSDLYAALGQYPDLSALVAARIYPDVAPQDAIAPRIVWQEISNMPVNGMDGANGLDNFRVQITSWADTSKGGTIARAVDAQVRAAMAAASAFKSLCVDQRALPFEPNTRLHGFQSDFSVWYST